MPPKRRSRALVVRVQPQHLRVQQVYMAVMDMDGVEVIYTVIGPNDERVPLVALDAAGLTRLKTFCQNFANANGRPIRIISFTDRNLYETLMPASTGD